MAAESKAVLKVFRFDPERDEEPYFDIFEINAREGMTVLEALFEILENHDNSLCFRYTCRGAVCGSCAMYINGAYRLACETQLSALGPGEITVYPLPHLAIIKDLVVDMAPFFEKFEMIMPYLKAGTSPEKERLQSVKDRKVIDDAINCIMCASCYSACPMTWANKDYLGPSALNKAYRFVADSRDEAGSERLALVSRENGIFRCHTIFNCVEACPKKIDQTSSIQQLKRKTMSHRLKFWRNRKGGR